MQQSHDQIFSYLGTLEADIDNLNKRLDYLSTRRRDAKKEVCELMGRLQDVLKQKMDDLLESLDDLYLTEKRNLQTEIRDKQAIATEMKNGLLRMTQMVKSGSEDAAGELGRLLDQRSLQYEDEDTDPRMVSLKFDVEYTDLIKAMKRLPYGVVVPLYEERGVERISLRIDSDEDYAKQANVIITKVEGDRMKPKISDIAVVEVDENVVAVVTDNSNLCIKAFYKRGGRSFYSKKSTESPPECIARIGNKVAVTLPKLKTITFLRVTPVLRGNKKIKTTKRYRGIAVLDSEKFAVSSYGTVDIIDNQGNIHHSIRRDRNGASLFESPFYLCAVPQQNIIVSDCDRRLITCMSVTGDIIFRYGEGQEESLKLPLGVAVDTFSGILAVDYENNTILKIQGNEHEAKEVFGKVCNVSCPSSIDIDAYGAVYIAERNGNIKIFNRN